MQIELKGRRAVVMGGSKGIGRSIALGLAGAGAEIFGDGSAAKEKVDSGCS